MHIAAFLCYFFEKICASGSKIFIMYFFALISNLQSNFKKLRRVFFYCHFYFHFFDYNFIRYFTLTTATWLGVKYHSKKLLFLYFFWIKASLWRYREWVIIIFINKYNFCSSSPSKAVYWILNIKFMFLLYTEDL